MIEEHNPEVEFDWTQILKGQETPIETRPAPQPARPQQSARFQSAREPQRQQSRRDFQSSAPVPAGPEPEALAAETESVSDTADALMPEGGFFEEQDVALAGGDPVPAGGMDEPEEHNGEAPATAAQKRLGPEALLRLRVRHAELLARISERVSDPVRRDELKAQAERLNPDTWVTDHEVRDGLEQYEAVFDSLRSVVGHRRKRRRRRRSGESATRPSGIGANAERAGDPAAAERSLDESPEEAEEEDPGNAGEL